MFRIFTGIPPRTIKHWSCIQNNTDQCIGAPKNPKYWSWYFGIEGIYSSILIERTKKSWYGLLLQLWDEMVFRLLDRKIFIILWPIILCPYYVLKAYQCVWSTTHTPQHTLLIPTPVFPRNNIPKKSKWMFVEWKKIYPVTFLVMLKFGFQF